MPPELHAGYSCGAVADFHRLPEHPSTILCDLCQSRGGTALLSIKISYLINQKGLQGDCRSARLDAIECSQRQFDSFIWLMEDGRAYTVSSWYYNYL